MAQGHPDWVRIDQWVGAPFLNNARFQGAANYDLGTFYVGEYDSLIVKAVSNGLATPGYALFAQYLPEDGGLTYSEHVWRDDRTGILADVIPNMGPFVHLVLTSLTAGNIDYNVTVVPRKGMPPAKTVHGDLFPYQLNPTNIAAGGNLTQPLLYCTSGPATFTVTGPHATWTARVSYVDAGGTSMMVAALAAPPQGIRASVKFDMPPRGLQVRIDNNGAVGSFNGSVVLSQ